ncbi:MAG: hypothetical protein ACR2G5_11680 [Pyrinomonadaceae bacterium]
MKAARVWLVLGLTIATFLAFEPSGLAQCAMCRASLAGSNNAYFIRNFNIGVLVLLTPPVAIFCTIFVVLKRHGAVPAAPHESDRHGSED